MQGAGLPGEITDAHRATAMTIIAIANRAHLIFVNNLR